MAHILAVPRRGLTRIYVFGFAVQFQTGNKGKSSKFILFVSLLANALPRFDDNLSLKLPEREIKQLKIGRVIMHGLKEVNNQVEATKNNQKKTTQKGREVENHRLRPTPVLSLT